MAMQTGQTRFQGSFSSTMKTTVKVSARVEAQINDLAKKLGKTPEEVAELASSLAMHPKHGNQHAQKYVAIARNVDSFNALATSPLSAVEDKNNLSVLAPTTNWQQWKKANLTVLSPGRKFVQFAKDQISKHDRTISFPYRSTEGEGAAALGFFAGILFPPLLALSLPALLLTAGRPKRSLQAGLTELETFVEAKAKDSSLELVTVVEQSLGDSSPNKLFFISRNEAL